MTGADKENRPLPRTLRMVQRGRPGQTARLVSAASHLAKADRPPVTGQASHHQPVMATPRNRNAVGLVVALALHAAIVAIFLLVWGDKLGEAEPTSVTVAVVNLPRPAPPPPPVIPDRPLPEEPQTRAEPMPLKPRPARIPPPPDIEPVSAPTPAPPQPQPPQPSPAPQPDPAPPQPATAALPTYAGEILARLARAKRYPPSSMARKEEGTVRVELVVAENGRVEDARIHTSSGYPALDKEALATVRRASPMPPVPQGLTAPLTLKVDISFSLTR